jgi:hypothetical protein
MVTTLSKLVDKIQGGAAPVWLPDYVLANKAKIEDELRQNGTSKIPDPHGEIVNIKAEKRTANAA